MQQFMLYIRNAGDAKAALSEEQHLAFIKKCETYIDDLQRLGKLIAAQPLVRSGFVVKKSGGVSDTAALDLTGQVQVGYYHIRAEDINEAIAIAKDNPEF